MSVEAVGGYMGKILRVDLSRERISEEHLDNETLRKYLGGTGMGVKYLYEEVPPGLEWNHPDNRIMFFSGPLNGTKVSGSGTFSVVTKGPMTNLAGVTQANGYFGAYLKFSGFDGIIIQGKAKGWRYLHVYDGGAEIRDARHLVGKDTWETEDTIKEELKRRSSVYSIGPAGENLVRFAAIVGDHGHVAGHNGVGAVIGSKKLKAIAVDRGHKKIPVFDPDRHSAAAKALVEDFMKRPMNVNWSKWGTGFAYPILAAVGQLPVKNYTTNIFPNPERFSGEYFRTHFKVKKRTCWACRLAHCREIEITEGEYRGFIGEEPEYEGVAAMSSEIGQTDPAATIVLGNMVDRLGLEINEAGHLMGWIMECYQKGMLKKSDLDGIEMTWGNVKATLEMLKRIAHRKGSGNLWAEGVKRAAEEIGGEAISCAIYTQKGASPRGHDHRARWNELIDTCFSNTGTIECGPMFPFADIVGVPPIKDNFDAMELSTANAKVNGVRQFEDSLCVCFFCVENFQLLIDSLNATTGWKFDISEAMRMGRRVVNQLRVFNFRHGLTKDMEAPSLRYGSTPTDGPAQGKHIMPSWEAMRRNYYQYMDWDPETGKPLPETLERLELAHLIPDLKG
jgi:aldehyde:ferredoxin oxidoreductase